VTVGAEHGPRPGVIPGMKARIASLLVVLAVTSTSCQWPLSNRTVDRLSAVYDVRAPDSVQAGLPFVIRFLSRTGDPSWRSGGEEIRSGAGGILIVPRDRYFAGLTTVATVSDVGHVLTLKLTTPGATRLWIRSRIPGSDGKDSSTTLVHEITVLR
jgi:hypothetical protein